eukprot:PhM_4_TR1440/c0_g2_i1/m.63241
MSAFQQPAVLWAIANKSSSFLVRRNGIVRSQDRLNVTGQWRKDDGTFAPANVQPVSFTRGSVKAGDKHTPVVVAYTRGKNGVARSFLMKSSNPKAVAKKVQNRKNAGRFAPFAAVRAGRVAKSLSRARSTKKN